MTVHVDPARPDAVDNPWARTVFVTLAEQWNCLVAVGQSPGATHVFCPNGQMIDLATVPLDFRLRLDRADGSVGAPEYVFGPDRRPLIEQIRGSWFSWDIAPPPWAQTGGSR